MAYATTDQIQNAAGGAARLVELADFDVDGIADVAVLAQAQAEVDGVIDSYVAKRYAVPVATPSLALQAASAAEVVYWLRSKRGGVADDHRREHEERLKWFEAIAKGHAVPSDPLPTKASTARSAWVERDDDDAVVSRASLEGAW